MALHPSDATSLEGNRAHDNHRIAAISVESQGGLLHPAFADKKHESDVMRHFASASELGIAPVEKEKAARKPRGDKGKDQPSIPVGNEANDFGGPASPEFNARVQKLVDQLPPEYRNFLNKHHIPVSTTELVDKDGKMTGGFNARTDRITLSENTLKDKNDDELSLTLRHEIAHGLDKAVGISGNRDFLYAAARDVEALSPSERERLKYYTAPFHQMEIFAEEFGRLNGGTPAQAARAKEIFPNASKWIEDNVKWSLDKAK